MREVLRPSLPELRVVGRSTTTAEGPAGSCAVVPTGGAEAVWLLGAVGNACVQAVPSGKLTVIAVAARFQMNSRSVFVSRRPSTTMSSSQPGRPAGQNGVAAANQVRHVLCNAVASCTRAVCSGRSSCRKPTGRTCRLGQTPT